MGILEIKKMKQTLIFAFISVSLLACSVKPQPINYGTDQCHSCKMNIIDRSHASEIVTKKGRAQKFDAIECMIRYMNENPKQENAHILVTDFDAPGELIDARTATYFISAQIPSPMGASLSAFISEKSIDQLPKEVKGKRYNWEEIQGEL